jgi:hypothetical protein
MIQLQDQVRIIQEGNNLPVFRNLTTQIIDGKPVVTQVKEFQIAANVQPMGARDLLLVPEGDRFKEQYWLWTPGAPLCIADRVVWCGANYEVQGLQNWGSYQQVRIMRIDVGPFATP